MLPVAANTRRVHSRSLRQDMSSSRVNVEIVDRWKPLVTQPDVSESQYGFPREVPPSSRLN